ncbi:MAG: hypothetical protein SOW45_06510 [Prevotella sp.]|nr:hypothetical protein [Prevotellaceae bacterium]MDY3104344.1 hypothetical protein [Prevotella sp.]MDY5842943.1 hypothetical protein [Prevotella sp.]
MNVLRSILQWSEDDDENLRRYRLSCFRKWNEPLTKLKPRSV